MVAAYSGHTETVKALIEAGADVNLQTIAVRCKKRNMEWNGMWNGTWNGIWNVLTTPQHC